MVRERLTTWVRGPVESQEEKENSKGRHTPKAQATARSEGDRHFVEGTMGVVGEIRLSCVGHVV